MPSLVERSRQIWNALRYTRADAPTWMRIRNDRVDSAEGLGRALRADQDYFEVRINELYVAMEQEWFSTFDPVVFVTTEFSYAEQRTAAPFVVGPTMLSNTGMRTPLGMVFANTRVAGPHPYRGGGIDLTVILYRSKRDNQARKLLGLVEKTTDVLDLAAPLSAYTKVAGLVLDGIEALTGTDGAMDPLMGRRDALSPVEPGYYVLTTAPPAALEDVWVRNRQLVRGPSLAQATSFREADYVLYSIVPAQRDDVSTLAFYPTWHRVVEEASRASRPEIWENAKAQMAALISMIFTSPDLTAPHKAELHAEWVATMVSLRERALDLAARGGGPAAGTSPELDPIRDQALSILRM